jgi:kinesin family protein 5
MTTKTASSEGLTVLLRVRPPILKEITEDTAIYVYGSNSLSLTTEKQEVKCTYDRVFNEVSKQSDIFERVQPLLLDVLSGINSCIFAYGQTSAGKSYTMIGPNGGQDILRCEKSTWGILPRAAEFLLGVLNSKADEGLITFSVKASFLQIYNENLYDLLRFVCLYFFFFVE